MNGRLVLNPNLFSNLENETGNKYWNSAMRNCLLKLLLRQNWMSNSVVSWLAKGAGRLTFATVDRGGMDATWES